MSFIKHEDRKAYAVHVDGLPVSHKVGLSAGAVRWATLKALRRTVAGWGPGGMSRIRVVRAPAYDEIARQLVSTARVVGIDAQVAIWEGTWNKEVV